MTVGLKSGNANTVGHVEAFKNFSGLRIDSPQITVITFRSGVPELSVNPGHSRDKAVGLDDPKNRAGLGIDLMDLAIPILTDPERSFRPRQPRVPATAGPRDGSEHFATLRINLLDAILGDLK